MVFGVFRKCLEKLNRSENLYLQNFTNINMFSFFNTKVELYHSDIKNTANKNIILQHSKTITI